MTVLPLLLFLAQEPLTADTIMARVAENQDRANQARASYVYHQDVLIRLNRNNGKLAREEYSEYTVTPAPSGTQRERLVFHGKYQEHGKTVEFDKPGFEHKSLDVDAGLTGGLTDSFGNDKKSRDGIERDMFPLTTREQRKYRFYLDGGEDYQGTPVYRITFEPLKNTGEDDDEVWAGEALIHRDEFQPVLVTTHLAEKIPMWVKAVLGTDVKALGFRVTYKKFDQGLWFPVTYGGEFQVKALFLYSRKVGLSLRNSDFHRLEAHSEVNYADIR